MKYFVLSLEETGLCGMEEAFFPVSNLEMLAI